MGKRKKPYAHPIAYFIFADNSVNCSITSLGVLFV